MVCFSRAWFVFPFSLLQIANNNEVGIGHLGALLGLLELLLGLAELGQVQGGDLLGLLDLLLVGLDLLLELIGQIGHAVLVLLVLVLGELELLHLAVGALEGLDSLAGLDLGGPELCLELSDSQLELAQGVLAFLHGATFGIGQPALHLDQLGLEVLLGRHQAGGVILLGAELISQPGGVNHGLLGLLLGILGSQQHTVNLGLDGVDGALQVALHGGVAGVDGLHLSHSQPGVSNLLGQLAVCSLRRVQKCARLLHLPIEGLCLPLGDANLFADLLSGSGLVLESLDGVPELLLVSLQSLQTLSIGLVSLVKTNLQLVDVTLELLLDPQGLSLGLLLSLKRNIE